MPHINQANMKYKEIREEKGFSHIFIICAVLVCLVIGLVGHRVYRGIDKSEVVPTLGSSESLEQTNEQTKEEDISPIPPAPVEVPPEPAPQAPAKTPKSNPAFTTTIQIKGDAACQSTTMEALKLLSVSAPSHYSTVTSYVSVIECAAQGSGMFAYESPPRYLVGDATRNAGTVWYAGTIAHDAGHSKLYHNYLSAHPGQSVPDDIWTGEAAERACLDAQHDAVSKIGGTQAQLDYLKNIINSQYYNVPYEQRWW